MKLSPEAEEAKKVYNREWRRNHPEKVAEYQNRYWTKKAREVKQRWTCEWDIDGGCPFDESWDYYDRSDFKEECPWKKYKPRDRVNDEGIQIIGDDVCKYFVTVQERP